RTDSRRRFRHRRGSQDRGQRRDGDRAPWRLGCDAEEVLPRGPRRPSAARKSDDAANYGPRRAGADSGRRRRGDAKVLTRRATRGIGGAEAPPPQLQRSTPPPPPPRRPTPPCRPPSPPSRPVAPVAPRRTDDDLDCRMAELKQINFTIVPDDNGRSERTYANFCATAQTPFACTLT